MLRILLLLILLLLLLFLSSSTSSNNNNNNILLLLLLLPPPPPQAASNYWCSSPWVGGLNQRTNFFTHSFHHGLLLVIWSRLWLLLLLLLLGQHQSCIWSVSAPLSVDLAKVKDFWVYVFMPPSCCWVFLYQNQKFSSKKLNLPPLCDFF